LFARNLANFLTAFWDKEKSEVVLPDDDEIVAGTRLTNGGAVVHERLKTVQ
jgi:NAD(P) transhydrogenase subunit alpha